MHCRAVDGADLTFGHLSLEQLGQDWHSRFERWRALLDQVGDGLGPLFRSGPYILRLRRMMTMAPLAGS